jgi:hypothetical protein
MESSSRSPCAVVKLISRNSIAAAIPNSVRAAVTKAEFAEIVFYSNKIGNDYEITRRIDLEKMHGRFYLQ